MQLLCKKDAGALKPANDESIDAFSRIKNGEILIVQVEQPRNPKMLGLYWHSLDMIVENHNPLGFTDKDKLHTYVRERLEVDSIKVSKMGQVEFGEFFERYKDLAEFELMPDVPRDVFWSEVGDRA